MQSIALSLAAEANAAPLGFPLSLSALAMSSVEGRPPPPQAVTTTRRVHSATSFFMGFALLSGQPETPAAVRVREDPPGSEVLGQETYGRVRAFPCSGDRARLSGGRGPR